MKRLLITLCFLPLIAGAQDSTRINAGWLSFYGGMVHTAAKPLGGDIQTESWGGSITETRYNTTNAGGYYFGITARSPKGILRPELSAGFIRTSFSNKMQTRVNSGGWLSDGIENQKRELWFQVSAGSSVVASLRNDLIAIGTVSASLNLPVIGIARQATANFTLWPRLELGWRFVAVQAGYQIPLSKAYKLDNASPAYNVGAITAGITFYPLKASRPYPANP